MQNSATYAALDTHKRQHKVAMILPQQDNPAGDTTDDPAGIDEPERPGRPAACLRLLPVRPKQVLLVGRPVRIDGDVLRLVDPLLVGDVKLFDFPVQAAQAHLERAGGGLLVVLMSLEDLGDELLFEGEHP